MLHPSARWALFVTLLPGVAFADCPTDPNRYIYAIETSEACTNGCPDTVDATGWIEVDVLGVGATVIDWEVTVSSVAGSEYLMDPSNSEPLEVATTATATATNLQVVVQDGAIFGIADTVPYPVIYNWQWQNSGGLELITTVSFGGAASHQAIAPSLGTTVDLPAGCPGAPVLPEPPSDWALGPVIRGQDLTLSVADGTPDDRSVLAFSSISGGTPYCPTELDGVCLDLSSPIRSLGVYDLDAAGTGSWTIAVPSTLTVDGGSFQLAYPFTDMTSSVAMRTVYDPSEVCSFGLTYTLSGDTADPIVVIESDDGLETFYRWDVDTLNEAITLPPGDYKVRAWAGTGGPSDVLGSLALYSGLVLWAGDTTAPAVAELNIQHSCPPPTP